MYGFFKKEFASEIKTSELENLGNIRSYVILCVNYICVLM